MKTLSCLLLLLLVSLPHAQAEEMCSCGAETVAVVEVKDTPTRHPLKGVVVTVLAEKSALLVKHEEIPGVMKAMTMLLNVDAETLKSPAATKGAAITGLLVRKADVWWLEEVAVTKDKT